MGFELTKHLPDLIVTGFMGLLWFDVRRAKINKADAQKDLTKTLTEYISEKEHVLLCSNATLKLSAEIKDMKEEILTAIKENGTR